MRKLGKTCFCLLLAITMLTTACSGPNEKKDEAKESANQQIRTQNLNPSNADIAQFKILNTGDAAIALVHQNGKDYVSLDRLVDILQFQSNWDASELRYRIGDNDVAYDIRVHSDQASKDGESVQLANEPILIQDRPYLTTAEAVKLFRDVMNYEISQDQLIIHPSGTILDSEDMDNEEIPVGENEKFSDAPTDAAAEKENEQSLLLLKLLKMQRIIPESVPVASVSNLNTNKLIIDAKKYLGVKYKFGAAPYSRSKRFDCSTFTIFIYGKQGVRLPRTARQQARKGVAVSRKQLRKGDLLFFAVPGRFKSSKAVGHVGIYMGGGRMIHSSPKPKNGVQITNINKPYWQRTFLSAKRVYR